ncbi:hypothetical protein ABWH96_17885 [Marivirga tractuosa]|uniref:tetratricopeptide repeat protein n=1 Tax=Marivirga tractuosa TaxID=1006 RepID=UPI0035CECB65
MNTIFELQIKEVKEALLERDITSATLKQEEASEILESFSTEEVDKNLPLIGLFHRLSISLLQNLHQKQAVGDLYEKLIVHLEELKKLDLATADDYLKISCHTEKLDISILEDILLKEPEHAQLIRDLGKYYLRKQEHEKAWICLRKAKDLCPEDRSTAANLYECCRKYTDNLLDDNTLNINQAEKLLKLYTEIYDSNSCLEVLNGPIGKQLPMEVKENYLAISYFRLAKYSEALALWRKLHEKDKLNSISRIAFAEFEAMNGNIEMVTDLLNHQTEFKKSDFSSATKINDLLAIWNVGSSKSEALHAYALLGHVNLQQNNSDKAEAIVKEGLELKPDDVALLLILVKVYILQNKSYQAIITLNFARKSGLSEPKFLLETAALYFRWAEWREALDLINQYHSIDLGTPDSSYIGGVAARNIGETTNAYQLLNLCITGFQSHALTIDALYQRATMSRSVFRFEEAMQDVEWAIRNVSEENILHRKFKILKGDLLFNLGQYEASYKSLIQTHRQQALEDQPLLYLQMLVHSGFGKEDGRPENLPILSNESIIQHPQDALDHIYNGKVQIMLKQYLDAAKSFVNAADEGYLPEIHYKKAFDMAKKAEAREYLIELYHVMEKKFILDFNTTAIYAFALYKTEKYEATISAYEAMAYKYPEMTQSKESRKIWSHTIAHSFQKLGQYKEAIQFYGILLSHMEIHDKGFMKRLQEIAEQRSDRDDFSRYSLLQYMKFENIALSEKEQKSLEALEIQMNAIRF